MLTSKVTDNDNFVSLPAASQALYMHLVMSADDDGFCSQITTAMFRAHAKKKDLEALVSARYLLRFENGVMVIKHWRMANSNRADRYTPTVYQDEYKRLTIKDNKSYTMANVGCQDGNQTATKRQPSAAAEENRREEKRREEEYIARAHAREEDDEDDDEDDGFETFWAAYPRKSGDIKQACFEYLGAIQSGVTPETILDAVKWQTEAKGERYMPSAEKWLRNRGWTEKKPENASAESTGKNFKISNDPNKFGPVSLSDYDFGGRL